MRLTCLHAVFTLVLFLLFACGEGESSSYDSAHDSETSSSAQEEAVTTSTPSPKPTAPRMSPPYPIEDSSRFETIQGIKIYTIVQGNGPLPKPGSQVVIHYRGTLMDGSEFDNSFARGTLADYSLNDLIKGWQIALTNVKVGSKVKLIIPPELGYGAQSRTNIPANSTLVFDIDLVSTY